MMIRLDLGCGTTKRDGFIGIDRYPLPGVDIVADLNQSLPIADNSVDLILAGHALEHIDNLYDLMKEIYRVCRHSAQICIVAPYGNQNLNLANPFHKQVFNEHTPRFWTNSPTSPIDPADYSHPHASGWGLAESDHRTPEMDFRCVRIEFFYFPEYRNLSPQEQRQARKKYLDVCDQIMYHLIAVKQPTSEGQIQKTSQKTEYYEPPYVTIRRLQERCESLDKTVLELRTSLDGRGSEIDHLQASLQSRGAEIEELRQELVINQEGFKRSEDQLARLETEVRQAKEAFNQAHSLLQSREADLEQARAVFQSRETELQAKLEETKQSLADTQKAQNSLQFLLAERGKELGEANQALTQAQDVLRGREAEFERVRAVFQSRKTELQIELEEMKRGLANTLEALNHSQLKLIEGETEKGRVRIILQSRETELEQIRSALANKDLELGQLRGGLRSSTIELEQKSRELAKTQENLYKSQVESLDRKTELEKVQALFQSHEVELGQVRTALQMREHELEQVVNKGKLMAYELDLFRRRKLIRWVNRFCGNPDLRDDISPAFQQLKDDSLMFAKKMKGYRLQPSVNLRGVPYLEYSLDLNRPNLSGILLAPILDLPSLNGKLGIEILSPSQNTVGKGFIPISQINESVPTRFDFSPIQDSDRECFRLRVFVHNVDTPVRLFEWRKYGAFGLGHLQRTAFCGFIFNNHT